jgi:hypothetical protein
MQPLSVDGLVRRFLESDPHPGDPKKVRKSKTRRTKRA